MTPRLTVAPATESDAAFRTAVLTRSWGGTVLAVHGELIDAAALPALVARLDGEPAGLLTHRAGRGTPPDWEITTVDAVREGAGVGTALLAAVRAAAEAAGARRLWLITTNDNTRALRFYQRRGYDLVALHRGAVDAARALKPAIPAEADGIPLRHELELELRLAP